MLNEKVYEWLKRKGYADRVTEHTDTIDTVEHAAQQIGWGLPPLPLQVS